MDGFSIGKKIKQLRVFHGLTQEELADRTELSKGFISQLERDLTSPSIATLVDILEALGSNLRDFFNESAEEKMVFTPEDMFVKTIEDEDGQERYELRWLIPNAQKNSLEPIMLTLQPGARFEEHDPHEGEEFGYVLSGQVSLVLGKQVVKAKKGDAFYFHPRANHYVENRGKLVAKLLWVATPPTF